jgi:uncharacterized protein (TIGR00369 family)
MPKPGSLRVRVGRGVPSTLGLGRHTATRSHVLRERPRITRVRDRVTKDQLSTSRSNVELFRRLLKEGWAPPVARLLGIHIREIEKERTTVEFEARSAHANPTGTLHGGILCDLADAAMGLAYLTVLAPDESCASIELKMNFVRPFWTGKLTSRARILHKGRTVALLDCRIVDEKRRLIAYATSTCITLPGAPGEALARPKSTRAAPGRHRPPRSSEMG